LRSNLSVRISVLILVSLLAGCATTRAPEPGPRFVPSPLEELAITPSAESVVPLAAERERGLSAEGPVVVGSRGHAFNVASSLHRVFRALGIPNEIRCEPSDADRRRIQIRFPAGLSESQEEDVRLLLGLIRREVATL